MALAQGLAPQSVTRRRWLIASLLGFGVLINYFDRINLSVAKDALHSEFGLSTVAFGYLLSAYSWTYALCQIPVGVLLDRFGVKRILGMSSFLWSVACFGAAAATGLYTFFAARLLLGVGESPTFPGNAKAVGYWFPQRERSLATALFDSGAKFSSAIGVPVLGLMLIHFGWRWSFAATGFGSLVFFALFYRFYRNPSEDPRLSREEYGMILEGGAQPESAATNLENGAPVSYLIARRKVLGLCLGFSAYNYTFYLLLTWMPSYLSAFGIDLSRSFLYSSVPWLVATVTDLVIGGVLVDQLLSRGWDGSRVRLTVMVVGMLFGLGIFGAAAARTASNAVFWISFSLAGLSAAAPVAWSVPSLIAPRESVGRIGGIVNFFSQITAIVAPIATGYIVDLTNSFKGAFVVAAVFLLIGVAGYAFMLGKIEPIPEPRT